MSLNGLDTVKVQQIFESTVAEAGGWFLLNYISRDEVDVYKSGTGGSLEFREAIGQYEEKSPLYGLLVYRRKRVLLKFVPEGTSRLLQARLTVHLQSVIERFPHDALLSLEAASDLTEAKLSSSVSALKTSGSIRSLNSVKRRPLTEIVEDAGEILVSDSQTSTPIDTPISDSIDLIPSSATTQETFDSVEKASNSTTKAIKDIDTNPVNDKAAIPRLSTTVDIADSQGQPSFAVSEARHSIESQKNHLSPISSSATFSYLHKAKVKLGPRPVDESRHSSPYVRPTSSLPAGILLQSRQRAATSTVMQQPASARVTNFSLSPIDRYTNGAPRSPIINHSPTYENRPVSRASVVTTSAFVQSSEETAITPEKRRLMKALQKRKQQQKARQLAREGKFNDEDMADHDGEREHGDDAQSFVEPNSARSVSPVKVHQISLSAQNSDTEEVSPSNDRNAVAELPQAKPEVVPLTVDTGLSGTAVAANETLSNELPTAPHAELALPSHLESSQHISPEIAKHDTISQHDDKIPQVHNEPESAHLSQPIAPTEERVSESRNGIEQPENAEEPENPYESKMNSYQPLELNLPRKSVSTIVDSSPKDEATHQPQEPDVSPISAVDQEIPSGLQHNELPQESGAVKQSEEETHIESGQEVTTGHSSADLPVGEISSNQDPILDTAHDVHHSIPNGTLSSPTVNKADPTTTDLEHEVVRDGQEQTTEHEVVSTPKDHTVISDEQAKQHDIVESSSALDEPSTAVEAMHEAQAPIQPELNDSQPHLPTVTSIRNSATHSKAASWSEEDSLLDEIHGATVQEATSISLAKTPPIPVSPLFTRQTDMSGDDMEIRESPSPTNEDDLPSQPVLVESTTSSPSILASEDPQPSDPILEEPSTTGTDTGSLSSRKGSRPNLSPANSFKISPGGYRQEPLSPSSIDYDRPASRKSAVSSLISQRIKAFEDKSSVPNSPHQTPASAVKAQIVTLRKVSLNTPPSQQAQNNPQLERTAQSYPTPSPSPHNLAQRLGFGKTAKKESVPKPTATNEKATKETISRLNEGVTDSLPSKSVSPERPVSPPESKGMRSLFSSKSRKKKSFSESSTPSLSKENPLPTEAASLGSSPITQSPSPESTERTLAPSSVESLVASDSEKKEQKKRPGLLKRLSTMSSSTHRSIAETINVPASEQMPSELQDAENLKKWKSTVALGELNIQFPDTLLWKRKQVEIDSQGFVILAPSQAEKHSKAITKRYHISDFKMPYVPEPDREELPYSVNLDFLDGSTIQCACDSSAGQQRVFQALTTARSAQDTA